MIEYTLNIGDVVTSPRKAQYACFGLGSCIGLFIQDRGLGISGGAHILLPCNEQGPDTFKFYSVTAAVNEILHQFRMHGSCLTALRAKVTGGANVIGVSTDTGIKNTKSVIRYLVNHKIYIAATDVGGNQFRTAKFKSDTGALLIRQGGENEIKVY